MEFLQNYFLEIGGVSGVLVFLARILIFPAWKFVKQYIPELIKRVFDYLEAKTKNEALKEILVNAKTSFLAVEAKNSELITTSLADGVITKEELKTIKTSLNASVLCEVETMLKDSKHIAIDWATDEIKEYAKKIVDSIAAKYNHNSLSKAVAIAADPIKKTGLRSIV